MTTSTRDNIVLIGYRATGKTTIGKILQSLLDWQYLSTDAEIERQVGEKISDYVAHAGWDEFREIERQVIARLGNCTKLIIDCGGGVIESPENMAVLTDHAHVIWVDAPIEILQKRLQGDASRPLLTQGNMKRDIEINYRRRYPIYQQYADFQVNSDSQTSEEICRKILQKVGIEP